MHKTLFEEVVVPQSYIQELEGYVMLRAQTRRDRKETHAPFWGATLNTKYAVCLLNTHYAV